MQHLLRLKASQAFPKKFNLTSTRIQNELFKNMQIIEEPRKFY